MISNGPYRLGAVALGVPATYSVIAVLLGFSWVAVLVASGFTLLALLLPPGRRLLQHPRQQDGLTSPRAGSVPVWEDVV